MADSDFWDGRFSTNFRFVRVDRATGNERGNVTTIKSGSVSRNQDTDVFETAQVDYVGSLDIGTDLLRIYLDAENVHDFEPATACLGTFLVSTPSTSIDGSLKTGTASLYGRLRELADDDFDSPFQVDTGANAVSTAAGIIRACGLDVVAESSDYTLSAPWVFGTSGGTEDQVDSKLAAVNKLLDAAGFNSAYTDPYGRVILSKYADPTSRPLARSFTEGENCHVMREMTDELDKFEISNVVHVDYTTQESSVRGTAVDDDPESEYSTVSVGRRIVKRYQYSDLPEGTTESAAHAAANLKAADLLKNDRSILRRITFTSIYAPVQVGDAVKVDIPTAGISRRYAIRTEDITLSAGCPIKIEARAFER